MCTLHIGQWYIWAGKRKEMNSTEFHRYSSWVLEIVLNANRLCLFVHSSWEWFRRRNGKAVKILVIEYCIVQGKNQLLYKNMMLETVLHVFFCSLKTVNVLAIFHLVEVPKRRQTWTIAEHIEFGTEKTKWNTNSTKRLHSLWKSCAISFECYL